MYLVLSTENNIYTKVTGGGLGDASPRTFFERQVDTRQSSDRIHQVRFVIPSSTGSDSAKNHHWIVISYKNLVM